MVIYLIGCLLSMNLYATQVEFLIDNFNDADKLINNIMLPNDSFTVGNGTINFIVETSIFIESPGALRIDFSSPGVTDRWGYITTIEGYDYSLYDRISFWVRGASGGEIFQITLKDKQGMVSSVPLYWVYPQGISTSFKHIQIDFEDFNFKKIDRQNLSQIIIESVPGKTGNGTIYIDALKLAGVDKLIVDDFDIRNERNLIGGLWEKEVQGAASLTATINYDIASNGILKLEYNNMSSLGKVWEYKTGVYGTGINFNNYDQVELQYRGKAGNEKFAIGLGDNFNNIFVITQTLSDTNWHNLIEPFSNFSTVDISQLKKIFFCNNTNSYSQGTLFFDNISVTNSTNKTSLIIDHFEGCNKYRNKLGYQHDARKKGTSTIYWDVVSNGTFSRDGGVLKIDFQNMNLYPNWWAWWTALASEDLSRYEDLTEYNDISFWVKGKNGGERFIVKVVGLQGDESWVYVNSYLPHGVATNWQKVTIPLQDFSATGIQATYHLKNLTFGADDLIPGEGTVYIDQIQFSKEFMSFSRESGSGSVIKWFYQSNISFSPNGDGKTDTITFEYVLNNPARVYLAIYDISGNIVRVLSEKKELKTEDILHTITWDGNNNAQSLVPGGLYIFQFLAVDNSGKEEKIHNLIEVFK